MTPHPPAMNQLIEKITRLSKKINSTKSLSKGSSNIFSIPPAKKTELQIAIPTLNKQSHEKCLILKVNLNKFTHKGTTIRAYNHDTQ
jgi:hypothetical protein